MSDTQALVSDVVQQACIDLFACYDVAIAPGASRCDAGELVLCGVIGFSGTDMRGTLMLGGSSELFELARAGHDAMMRDWLAELTNQLLGRIKNQLYRHGVEIHCSTPVVLGGERVATIASQPLGHLFTAGDGVVSVWFDSETRSDLVLALFVDSREVGREGEMVLF